MSLESLEEVREGTTPVEGDEVDLTSQVFGTTDDAGDSDDAMMAGYQQEATGEFQDAGGEEGAGTPGADGGAGTTENKSEKQPVRIGRWTEDELAARFDTLDGLKKSTESVAGLVGHLKQRLEQSGAPRKIQASDLKNVTEQFGEEFTTALVNDLNALGGLGGSAGPDKASIEGIARELIGQQAQEIEQRLEYKAVKRRHPDADDFFVRQDAEGKPVPGKKALQFRQWIGSLPPARQQVIASAWDRDTVDGFLTEFKQSAGGGTQDSGETRQTPAQQRANRLKRAVTPPSSGGAARPAAEDPFEAGYKAAKGGG